LKSIANNPEIDEIYERMHPTIETALMDLNMAIPHPTPLMEQLANRLSRKRASRWLSRQRAKDLKNGKYRLISCRLVRIGAQTI